MTASSSLLRVSFRSRVVLVVMACVWSIVHGSASPITHGHRSDRFEVLLGISGVVAGDDGVMLRNATIQVLSSDFRIKRSAATDASGRYEIPELPAGSYSATASKTGYLPAAFGQQSVFGIGRPFELTGVTPLTHIDFRLTKASVISGTTTDEYGDALANARVSAIRYTASGLVPAATAVTNDIGEFRLFDLKPGRYYVAARPGPGSPILGSNLPTGYAPSYYPGTPTLSEASRIEVAPSQTVANIRVPIRMVSLSRISGIAIDSFGRPLSGRGVSVVQLIGTMKNAVGTIALTPDGSFQTTPLPPGTYVLNATALGGVASATEFASTEVIISGGDVNGVQLATLPLGHALGRIVPPPGVELSVSRLHLSSVPVSPKDRLVGAYSQGLIKPDFTFDLTGRVGRSRIQLVGLPPTMAVKSVTLHGEDVTESGIQFMAHESTSGVEVILSDQVPRVSGLVKDQLGVPVAGCPVTIFPQNPSIWSDDSRRIQSQQADRQGHFRFMGLPPGDYLLVAFDNIDPGLAADPDYLRLAAPKAVRLSLTANEGKELNLRPIALGR